MTCTIYILAPNIRKILQELKPFAEIDEEWQEYIVWTNLYPVTWKDGSMDERLRGIQAEFAKEILKQQIEYYRPTHVLSFADGNRECLGTIEVGKMELGEWTGEVIKY